MTHLAEQPGYGGDRLDVANRIWLLLNETGAYLFDNGNIDTSEVIRESNVHGFYFADSIAVQVEAYLDHSNEEEMQLRTRRINRHALYAARASGQSIGNEYEVADEKVSGEDFHQLFHVPYVVTEIARLVVARFEPVTR